ncbi:hypothetical protein ABZZ80_38255, partial [Streptomyces sp. NPDC006356]
GSPGPCGWGPGHSPSHKRPVQVHHVEIAFDAGGGARTVAVTPQQRQQRSMLWLNEDSPTFLVADPPATAGEDRFRLEFRIDAHKRLTVTAYDLRRHTLVLDRQPVVRLA